MNPIFDYRISIHLPKQRFPREVFKKTCEIMRNDPRTSIYYTGHVGRQICFQFPNEEAKDKFKKHIQQFIDAF